jgi:hypothetical protein
VDTHAIVSEVRRDVADTHAIVSDIRHNVEKIQEGVSDQNRPVSDTLTISAIGHVLIVAQTQARSANSIANGVNILYLHLAPLVNHLPRHRGPVSDVTN